jgi:signal transduction histidine kinase
MRGGLGRTLLTAFLLLSIVPLGLISFLAATQARCNLQKELEEKLVTIATLTESQIHSWIANQQLILAILSNDIAAESQDESQALPHNDSDSTCVASNLADSSSPSRVLANQAVSVRHLIEDMSAIRADNPSVAGWLLLNQLGCVLAAHSSKIENLVFPRLLQDQRALFEVDDSLTLALPSKSGKSMPMVLKLTQSVADSGLSLVALLDPASLSQMVSIPPSWKPHDEIYLVSLSGQALKLHPPSADHDLNDPSNNPDQSIRHRSVAIEAALSGESGSGSYENYQGVTVIGAYRWLPDLNLALLVEQPQDSALASSEELAVVLIGATLAVVLLTAFIAALVTRRITLPIVQLTATAVQIAAGDLDQKVPATRRDEIGILARAFNVMTTKLRVLYADLEQKVEERTQQLQQANAEIRYRAMQLAISAEVGRVVTSILDQDILLSQVVELIRDCFQAYFVGIYFVDVDSQWAVFQEGSGGLGEKLKATGHRVELDQDLLLSQAIHSLEPQVCTGPSLDAYTDRRLFPHTRAELAVPLKIGGRTIGVLDVHSTHQDAFAEDEMMVLETLSGQVVVAIENARLYETERQAAEQLRKADELRRRFLSNMSRELRMPLNNIIGFSRVILKGIDGPITDFQREDLNAIHDSGQQLLVLFNDILDIAQIEAGAMELDIRPIDFGEIAHSVIPTVNALLQGRPIKFKCRISSDLPPVLADPHRLRQVLLKLLSNAAKFTYEGEIELCVWRDNHQIMASVRDTGIGIPEKDRDKVFEMFRQLSEPIQSGVRGTGLGLALSKEIVEMHGGSIWFESQEGRGTAFTVTLPTIDSKESTQ